MNEFFRFSFQKLCQLEAGNTKNACKTLSGIEFVEAFGKLFLMKPNLHLVFAPEGGMTFLLDAYTDVGEGTPTMRKLLLNSISSTESFRCICILLFLAKHQNNPDSQGIISFMVNAKKGTWIYTLAGTRPTEHDNWYKDTFGVKRFLNATRGSGNKGTKPPSAQYLANILPLKDVHLYSGSLKQPFSHEKLADYADKLEIEGQWSESTVPIILGKVPDKPDCHTLGKDNDDDWENNWQAMCRSDIEKALNRCKDEDGEWKDPIKRDEIYAKLKHEYLASLIHYCITSNLPDMRPSLKDKHCAIRTIENHKEFLQDCNIPITRYRETALVVAIKNRNREIIDYFLDLRGIDPNARTTKGITPLLTAARYNDLDIIKRLIKLGADPNALSKQGANAIYEAAFGATENAKKTIEYLLELGLSSNVTCLDGSTPLSIALSRKCPEDVIRLLALKHLEADSISQNRLVQSSSVKKKKISKISSLNRAQTGRGGVEDSSGQSDLLQLFAAISAGDLAQVEFLIHNRKAKAYQADLISGDTPLHKAAEIGNLEMVRLFMQYSAYALRQNKHGRTPRDLISVQNGDGNIGNAGKGLEEKFLQVNNELKHEEGLLIINAWNAAGYNDHGYLAF